MGTRSKSLTGGYYWLPTPVGQSPSWEVVTCHQLGVDAEAGHVEMWNAVIARLGAAWDKDVALLGQQLKDCFYGLPRGRVTRTGKQFLVLHGGDSPRPDWLALVLSAFRLERRRTRVLYDEHERTMAEDSTRLLRVIDLGSA